MKNNGFFHNICFFVGHRTVVAAALICLVVAAVSCRTIKTIEVPVYIHDTTYVKQSDSVTSESSIVVEKETIVKEADSALLAQLGIKLKENERAILLLRRELEKQNNETSIKKTDTVYKTKEVPVPYEVKETEYVEKELKWWQKSLMFMGGLLLFGMIVYIVQLALVTIKT